MARQQLKLATLPDIDGGKLAAAFDISLDAAIQDCLDRSSDTRARKVCLEITIKPNPDEGVTDLIDVEGKIIAKVPARQSRIYQMQTHPTGRAFFNPASHDDVRQGTLDEAKGDGNDKKN